MLELIAVLLFALTAALAWLLVRQRGQTRTLAALLANTRATLANRQSALAELESTLRKRDAALVSLQQSLASGQLPSTGAEGASGQNGEFARQIAMLNIMLNATDDALIIVDASLRVVLANAATAAIFGSAEAGVHLETLTASP